MLSFQAVDDRMNSDQANDPPAALPFTGIPPIDINIFNLDPPVSNLSDHLATAHDPWLGETAPESIVLFPPSGEQFQTPRGPSAHTQNPQSEKR